MANPPYGDSTLDPSLPTYAAGTIWKNAEILMDSAKTPVPTGSTAIVRSSGVGTTAMDFNNGTHENRVPKDFPALQS
jgi:hypothetical protein